jgi:hypothetical protein
MPVITQSQARGGQQGKCSASPLLLSPTCSNAITSSLKKDHPPVLEDSSIDLPEIIHQTQLSSSSSEHRNSSTSSLDNDFENLEFQNFNLSTSPEHTASDHFDLSQFSRMESDY